MIQFPYRLYYLLHSPKLFKFLEKQLPLYRNFFVKYVPFDMNSIYEVPTSMPRQKVGIGALHFDY